MRAAAAIALVRPAPAPPLRWAFLARGFFGTIRTSQHLVPKELEITSNFKA
jgi:hypothetical protein